MKTEITASCDRRANGWAAVLEYPNGGRQRFAQRFGTMEDAQKEARHLLRVRLAYPYPYGVIQDPLPNRLMDLEEISLACTKQGGAS